MTFFVRPVQSVVGLANQVFYLHRAFMRYHAEAALPVKGLEPSEKTGDPLFRPEREGLDQVRVDERFAKRNFFLGNHCEFAKPDNGVASFLALVGGEHPGEEHVATDADVVFLQIIAGCKHFLPAGP